MEIPASAIITAFVEFIPGMFRSNLTRHSDNLENIFSNGHLNIIISKVNSRAEVARTTLRGLLCVELVGNRVFVQCQFLKDNSLRLPYEMST